MKKLLYNLFASQSEASLDDSNHILESGKFQQKKGAPNNTTTACVMGSGATNNGQPSPTRSRSNATIALTTTTMTTAIVEALEEGCEMNKERTVVRKLMNCNRQAVALGEERLSMWARMLYHLDEMKYQLFHPHIETTSQLMSMLDGLQCMGDVRCRGNNNNNGSNGSEESVIATVFDDMKPDMERIKNEHELSFFSSDGQGACAVLVGRSSKLGPDQKSNDTKALESNQDISFSGRGRTATNAYECFGNWSLVLRMGLQQLALYTAAYCLRRGKSSDQRLANWSFGSRFCIELYFACDFSVEYGEGVR